VAIRSPRELGIIKKELPLRSFIAGLDEVGRGPLAGPVVAGCAFLKWESFSYEELFKFFKSLSRLGITDSKKIPSEKRMEILNHFGVDPLKVVTNQFYSILKKENLELGFSLYEMGPLEIDKINILNASLNSMAFAFKKCRKENFFGEVLVDGNKLPKDLGENLSASAIVGGDSKSLLIALASILAKEYRDNLMKKMDLLYPQYNFQKNMGYPTQMHKMAIKKYGITPIHRKSFRGVIH
jgi:ribonuclease HII